MSYYLTFDLGTTALKTALVDDDGRVLAVAVREYALHAPAPEIAEMAPETYWRAAVDGTREVFAKTSVDASAVAAIGFSSQGQTYMPIDRAGNPLSDFIVWLDNRAQAVADTWAAEWLTRDEFHQMSGYPWIPATLTLFKIAWQREHAPATRAAWQYLCLPDYLIYRLTGETVTDYVTARMSGLFDLRTGTWAPQLLVAAGISTEQLPRIQSPGTIAGTLTASAASELGLRAGVPVCTGANDQLVGGIGAGNVKPGIVSETTGTALAVVVTTPELLRDDRVCMGRHAQSDMAYAMTFTNTSAIILTWFRELCGMAESRYDAFLAGVDAVPPGCDGLTVLPHFAGTLTDPTIRGAFLGLSLSHTRAHMARAIMEACACMLQDCLTPMLDHGLPVHAVQALGGAARSDLWLQMKADLLGLPVERPACSDTASLGAAMLAAVAIGRFPDLPAAAAWHRTEQTFTPDPTQHDAYRAVYARYQAYGEMMKASLCEVQ